MLNARAVCRQPIAAARPSALCMACALTLAPSVSRAGQTSSQRRPICGGPRHDRRIGQRSDGHAVHEPRHHQLAKLFDRQRQQRFLQQRQRRHAQPRDRRKSFADRRLAESDRLRLSDQSARHRHRPRRTGHHQRQLRRLDARRLQQRLHERRRVCRRAERRTAPSSTRASSRRTLAMPFWSAVPSPTQARSPRRTARSVSRPATRSLLQPAGSDSRIAISGGTGSVTNSGNISRRASRTQRRRRQCLRAGRKQWRRRLRDRHARRRRSHLADGRRHARR